MYKITNEGAYPFDYPSTVLDEIRRTLRIMSNTDDPYLTTLITNSISLCEKYTNRIIAGREFIVAYSSAEPSRLTRSTDNLDTTYVLPIPLTPVFTHYKGIHTPPRTTRGVSGRSSVHQARVETYGLEPNTVTYIDIPSRLDTLQEYAEVSFTAASNTAIDSIPQDNIVAGFPMSVQFYAGYLYYPETGIWEVPTGIRQAIIDLTVYMYENPTACDSSGCGSSAGSSSGSTSGTVKLPTNVVNQLASYRVEKYGNLYF